ncbi:MAG TPA: glutamine--fructose-6-phosphate transaminase (isomerizing), partial [Gammaproteobacteria bacterium]|nr:glutamine--fructose-6-phosphate transaminase (isomerizing) [Gammaproteobacteria bacterium]
SAGIAVINNEDYLERSRVLGKVKELEDNLGRNPLKGTLGIAHTRWATHGEPSIRNAHPHISCNRVALVHNGIIENHAELRARQQQWGYEFTSETDTEVVVHQVNEHLEKGKDLLAAVIDTVAELEGAYALGVISVSEPDRLVAARRGSPLIIGVGIGEHFIASDVFALLLVTQRFIFLEDGDVADIRRDQIILYDAHGRQVDRPIALSELTADVADKAGYRHYMLKEIFTQPKAVVDTLEGRIVDGRVLDEAFGMGARAVFEQVCAVQIVACGTSYHAGLVARYWMEAIAGIPCHAEVASEFRYRKHAVTQDTLFVTISQSGETADTLAALRQARRLGYTYSLGICNVPESSLIRESDLVFMTRAGPEIGVASTKAFTTQLVALMLLVIALARHRGLAAETEHKLVSHLESLPGKLSLVLELNEQV